MKTNRMMMASLMLGMALMASAALPAQAQTTTTTTTTTTTPTSATDAVTVAKGAVDASLRDKIVSVYGEGAPASISTWWVIFYDPSVASHGRAVKIVNGTVASTYEAKGGVVYSDALTFPGTDVVAEGAALTAAQNYAAQHAIAYDHVRALLRQTSGSTAMNWRIQLMNGTTNKGFVFVKTSDGVFASYAPAGAVSAKKSSGTGGVAGDLEHAGHEVKNTFLGIGGDLQEFFTGERTVDQ